VTKRLKGVCVLFALAVIIGGCAAGQAFRRGDEAMKNGDLDQAVAAFRDAVQADPDNPRYKISLERAMQAASRFHLDRAHQYEQQEQLEAALGEYKLSAEYDPSNRGIAGKVASLEKTLRDRLEAARPKPPSQQLRDRARAASTETALNPASREPLVINFVNTNFKDILTFVGNYAGINVSYDREVVDRPSTVQLSGVTLEQALNQIMTMNQLSYKVVNEKSIFVFQDTVAKHTQYDEQVIKTFYIQHADATEVVQLLSQVIRLPNMAIQPAIAPNRTNNTITIRASTSVMQILEKLIEQHDKPRAEIVFDIEILEVDRERAKTYGLDLTQFAVGGIFSPEVSPSGTTTQTPGAGTPTTPGGGGNVTTSTTGQATAPNAVGSPPPFNLNTISRGFSTSDFYLAVPAAIVRFLESDTRTKVLAKPQLRGTEGFKATVNLGTEVPIVTTSYTPIATGGAGVNPLNSFNLKPVGINIDITPRVTLDGDILIDLTLESSAQGPDQNIAGTNYPSFVTRKVGTHLRLRDGESNLLAGLLREDDRTSVRGFPGAIHVPVLKQAFSANDNRKSQIDLIMLLTPHIVRSNEITELDLKSTFIGSQQNLGLGGGPPPLIAPAPEAEPATPPAATPPATTPRPPAAPGTAQPGGAILTPPPGSPVPGFVPVPQTPAPAPQTPAPAPATATPPAATPPTVPPPQAPQPAPPTPQSAAPTVPEPPSAGAPVGSAQVVISPPGGTFRIGQGPYTVPLSIVGAARLTTISLTITYDPAVLRVRSVQEGSFMRLGGANATFTQEAAPGRIDITITRSADATGASGTGLLAAVVFDAIAPGTSQLTASGVGTGPGGTSMGLQFRPVTVAVQR
jgi:general secretion pathway protein D